MRLVLEEMRGQREGRCATINTAPQKSAHLHKVPQSVLFTATFSEPTSYLSFVQVCLCEGPIQLPVERFA